jgi:peroxiredoxin
MSVNIRTLSTIVILTALFATAARSSALSLDSSPSPILSPAPEDHSATVEKPRYTDTISSESDSLPIEQVFSVSTIDGENTRLEDLLGVTPVYLVFVPSTTDELDISQMRVIQSKISEFDELDAEVVVVISDQPTRVIEMRDELGLDFPLIADPLNVVASDWQVFDLNNSGESSPASFVFDAHGGLIAQLIATDAGNRPTVTEVLSVIEESLSVGAV